MTRLRSIRSLLLIMLATVSCVDTVVIEQKGSVPKIVIDAYFTTNAKFNTVRISSSADFSNDYPFVPFNAPVEDAIVKIFPGDSSAPIVLAETSPGMHETEAVADVSESYSLHVTLPDGRIYVSDLQPVAAPVAIDSLSFTITHEMVIEKSAGSYLERMQYVFNLNVSAQDPPGERNYYLWRAHGMFEYFTLPPGDAPCNYCFCWAPVYPMVPYVNVMSDQYLDRNTVFRKIGTIKYDRDTPYFTEVYQFAITSGAFKFWNSVATQQSAAGSIFDPSPQRIRGNLVRQGDPEEEVFGYFTTASVTDKFLMIERGEETKKRNIIEPNLIVPTEGDCRGLYTGATHIKPPEFYD